MAQTNNPAVGRLVQKCNRAHDKITFNKQYPSVYEQKLAAKDERRLKELEQAGWKRLLQLEIAAKPEAEVNQWRIARAMEEAEESQVMKRRAIEQTYQRDCGKKGEEAAAAARDKALAVLDKALSDKRAALEAKYPPDAAGMPTAEAIAKFEAAEVEEAKLLEAERQRLETARKAKVEKVTAEMAAKNTKLQAEFDAAIAELRTHSKISEEDFGEDTILSIRNLKMYFSGVKAVDDISFDIKQGEIFGLIGPNGAGKTTIFNCVTQFYKPTAGNVFYRDRFGSIVDLTDYKTHDVIKTGIARTFQNLELVMTLPVMGNLLVGAHSLFRTGIVGQLLHFGQLKKEEEVNRARARQILKRLGLTPYMFMLPQGLPYGVLKKVELARTLMTNPRIIILDEPAAGLNDAETMELAETIRKIRDDFGCTIFLVEHDMGLVMNLCDTVCVCSFGKRLAIGTPEEIQNNPLVQEAYLGTADEEEEGV